ncbi:MAG TPA: hypothetical protein PK683_03475 [Leptospiraceae bacterium]|nr:hypothetical protein [Leptospiraceae bacterium]HNO23028.1 hypothetical protein [Leptospiraceae bacterium]
MRVCFLAVCIILAGCKKKYINEDIPECDSFGNYYENGEHYISREFLTESGSLDYKKLFDKSRQQNSNCYPTETFREPANSGTDPLIQNLPSDKPSPEPNPTLPKQN